MKWITVFVLLLTLVSCNRSEQQSNTYEVLSLLIKEYGRANPPPPPPSGNVEFSKSELDSIYSQIQHIGIHPIMNRISTEVVVKKNNTKSYFSLVQNLSLLNTEQIDISLIDNTMNHELTIIDTIKYKNDKYYISKNFDRLLHFAPISFNKEYTKACTIIGKIVDYLNGYSVLIYLEKINDKWVIKETELLEIS